MNNLFLLKASKESNEAGACGLCGSTGSAGIKIGKTSCCNNWICLDEHTYEASSNKLNSCQRNHERYTFCCGHNQMKHPGKYTECEDCQSTYKCRPDDTKKESTWKKFIWSHFYFENVGEQERARNLELKHDGTRALVPLWPIPQMVGPSKRNVIKKLAKY